MCRRKGACPCWIPDVTVAEVLKSAGYTTGMTGKWGLGEPNTTGVPNRQGFDEWFGFLNQRHAHTYYPEYLWRNEQFEIILGNTGGHDGTWIHDLFTEFALEFVERQQDRPFFLYIPYTIPHGKYEVPDVEPYTDRPWDDAAQRYAAMVTRMDSDIGRLLDSLKTLGLDAKTIVFFCSDNGGNVSRRADQQRRPIKRAQGQPYEGGIRTPMIVRWPGQIEPGRVK